MGTTVPSRHGNIGDVRSSSGTIEWLYSIRFLALHGSKLGENNCPASEPSRCREIQYPCGVLSMPELASPFSIPQHPDMRGQVYTAVYPFPCHGLPCRIDSTHAISLKQYATLHSSITGYNFCNITIFQYTRVDLQAKNASKPD